MHTKFQFYPTKYNRPTFTHRAVVLFYREHNSEPLCLIGGKSELFIKGNLIGHCTKLHKNLCSAYTVGFNEVQQFIYKPSAYPLLLIIGMHNYIFNIIAQPHIANHSSHCSYFSPIIHRHHKNTVSQRQFNLLLCGSIAPHRFPQINKFICCQFVYCVLL